MFSNSSVEQDGTSKIEASDPDLNRVCVPGVVKTGYMGLYYFKLFRFLERSVKIVLDNASWQLVESDVLMANIKIKKIH